MKIKIIRKILAFAIVASTVATMPGVASAIPKKSNPSVGKESKTDDKKSDQDEEEEEEEEEEINTSATKLNKEQQSKINDKCDKKPNQIKINDEKEISTNEIKSEQQSQTKMIEEDQEKSAQAKANDMILKLDNLLNQNSFNASEKSAFLGYVGELSGRYSNNFYDYFQKRKTVILDLLAECDRKDETVVEICLRLCDLMKNSQFNKYELEKILDIFLDYESQFDGQGDEYAACEFMHAKIWRVVYKLFENYSKDLLFPPYYGQGICKFMTIFRYLIKYIGDDPDYDVLSGMDYFARNPRFLKLFSPPQLSDTIDAMHSLLTRAGGKKVCVVDYANIIVGLVENCFSKGCGTEQISKLRDIVIKLVCDEKFSNLNMRNGVDSCVGIISNFKEKGILAGLSAQQNLEIAYKLAENIDNYVDVPVVEFTKVSSGDRMILPDNTLFADMLQNKYSMEYINQPVGSSVEDIISYFGQNIDYNELRFDEENAKKTAFIIKNLVSVSKKVCRDPSVFDVLNKCVNVPSARRLILATLSEMSLDKSIFFSVKLKMPQLLSILKTCVLDDAGKLPVSSIVASLMNHHFMKGASDDEKRQIIEILNECTIDGPAHSNVMFSLTELLFYFENSYDLQLQYSIISSFIKFAKTGDEKREVLRYVEHFLCVGEIGKSKENWKFGNLSTLLNFLLQCDNGSKETFIYIIEKFVQAGLVGHDETEMELINKILLKYSDDPSLRESVVNFIEKLLKSQNAGGAPNCEGYSLLGDYSKIKQIVNILEKCSNDCYADIVARVISAVKLIKSSYRDIKNDDQNFILKKLVLLMNRLANNNASKQESVNFIGELLRDGCFSDDYVIATIDLLKKCSRYSNNDLKRDILVIVKNLINGGYINSENFEFCRNALNSVMLNCKKCGNYANYAEVFALINSKFAK